MSSRMLGSTCCSGLELQRAFLLLFSIPVALVGRGATQQVKLEVLNAHHRGVILQSHQPVPEPKHNTGWCLLQADPSFPEEKPLQSKNQAKRRRKKSQKREL